MFLTANDTAREEISSSLGLLKIARRFSAGFSPRAILSSPVRDDRTVLPSFGTWAAGRPVIPALKRWAITSFFASEFDVIRDANTPDRENGG